MFDDDVLDLARLTEAYEDDVAGIATMLALARETEKRLIAALRAAIESADLKEVARAAHSIKGSASNIGAATVSGTAARIEESARVGTWDGVAENARRLDAAYGELCDRIALYAAKIA